MIDRVNGIRNVFGRVVDDRVFKPLGKILLQFLHPGLDLVGGGQRVRSGALENPDRDRLLAVEVRVQAVAFCAEFNARDIGKIGDASILIFDDDRAELFRCRKAPLRRHRILEGVVGGGGRLAQRTARHLNILGAQGIDHVVPGQISGGELVRVEPDADRVFAFAENACLAYAVDAGQFVLHVQRGVVGDVKLVERGIGRKQVHDHQKVGRGFIGRNAQTADVVWQAGQGGADAVLHLHLREIEVGADLEGDGQAHRPVGGGVGGHVQHVLDAVDRGLKRVRDRVGDGLGIGAGIGGGNDDGGRDDFGVLRDRQVDIGDRPDHHHDDRDDGRENRAFDEEMPEFHCALSFCPESVCPEFGSPESAGLSAVSLSAGAADGGGRLDMSPG